MPKKRRSMGKGVQKVSKNRKGGSKYLDIPEGFELFRPEGGKRYKFDVLPYIVKNVKKHPDSKEIPDDIWWRFPYGRHSNIGPENEMVICPATIGKSCIICTEKQAIYDDPDGDNDDAGKLNASKRGLYVIQMKSGKKSGKIMLLDISNYCFLDQVMDEIDMGEPEWKNFPDLEGGYTLKVRFKSKKIGSGKNATEFPMADRVDFLERDDLDEDILDEVPCLDDLISIPTSKQAENSFYGVEDDEDEDETPKEKPKKGKKKKAKKDPEPEPEENTDLDWDDLVDMGEDELIEVAEAEELEIDEDDYDDDDELRDLIADALEIEKPKKGKKKKAKKDPEPEPKKKGGKGKDKKAKKGKKEKTTSTKKALECPYAYQFGVEFEDHEECDEDECKRYEACMETFENE